MTPPKIKQFIVDEFMPDMLAGRARFRLRSADRRRVDSLGLLKLVAWMESEFGVSVDESELGPDSFRTVDAIKAFIERGASRRMPNKPPSEALAALADRGAPVPEDGLGRLLGPAREAGAAPGRGARGPRVADDADAGRRHDQRADAVAAGAQPAARSADEPTVNIVGTGGGPSTFNLSTASAFVGAALGARVIKTGSRAYTSRPAPWTCSTGSASG